MILVRYVYGPVPSRRLGQSLGVDPLPAKTCNWNCVYCQLGRTAPVTARRGEFFPVEDILGEVRAALAGAQHGSIDWVTVVGSGEPALYSQLGQLISGIKEVTTIPVAVITNGSLLYDRQVRDDLSRADAVLPTLDAGDQRLFRHINRPHPSLSFRRHLEGLREFRKAFRGKLWPEVMLIRGMNDGEEALRSIAAALASVAPDEIHLSLPERPPAESGVLPADPPGLMRPVGILGSVARVLSPAAGRFDLSHETNLADAIVGVITRHPMRDTELRAELGRIAGDRVEAVLSELAASGRAQVVERYGTHFWTAGGRRYGG